MSDARADFEHTTRDKVAALFPEHNHLELLAVERALVLEFLDWLGECDMAVFQKRPVPEPQTEVSPWTLDRVIDRFFETDTAALVEERKRMKG